jgi:hypothetical protein
MTIAALNFSFISMDYRQASYQTWGRRMLGVARGGLTCYPYCERFKDVVLVKPSKHIYVSGLCGIEYVLNWEKKYKVGLCHIAVAQI